MRFIPILWAALLLLPSMAAAFGDPAPTTRPKTKAPPSAEALTLNDEQRRSLGIEVAAVRRRALAGEILAPGEVRLDAYRSAQVAPRVSAQIVARHARLGDRVTAGRPLVTLSSVTVAEAQGALFEADREWRRVRRLGRAVVSAKRYVASQVARQRAYAALLAYGMAREQIDRLLKAGDASRATGTFDLLSPLGGTVIRDDFVVGELAKPGRPLFEISDDSVLWVEARLAAEDAGRIARGATAHVAAADGVTVTGTVVQFHQALDPATRTLGVRIRVDNRARRLHPGQYVDVTLSTAPGRPVLAVPARAVVLMAGATVVFRARGRALVPEPVETGVTRSGWTEIRRGLKEGDRVVITNPFPLKAMLLKSQLGEGH